METIFDASSSSLLTFTSIVSVQLDDELSRSTIFLAFFLPLIAFLRGSCDLVQPGPGPGGRTRSRGNIFADSAVKFPYIWPLIVFGLSFRNWLRFDSV